MKVDSNSAVLEFIRNNPNCSSMDIFEKANTSLGLATIKRILQKNVGLGYLQVAGKAKNTRYSIGSYFQFLYPIDIDDYFKKEIDERNSNTVFNYQVFEFFKNCTVFEQEELDRLNVLQDQFAKNTKHLTDLEYHSELERLAIDLSWKSSQIEGNTYSLLETERLLKDKETASGKTKEEAIMLLNHKEAIDFIVVNPDYLETLTVSKLENIHSLLIKDLNVDKNIRKRRVGITGTNYRPIDNEFQIREALEMMCGIINTETNVFIKSLYTLVLLSYIQAFNDGNKRTARIVSNAILLSKKYCPISFRTVDTLVYKKAMLVFYEQNNIYPFKKIFIEQFDFAVKHYF
ncbi:Fic family protein [Flavobacterium nackdongense]|uniref:Fic family protein n=1 Tax=Flavobacterium nackdongense TaxID=2547394 RepID=A0A4P6Y9R8_9FLAO|nr:Fic family protein [Flavobacterium nackdongense]QBN19811.1 Fic family protein [Flavobacterium nackdongense]